MWQFTVFCLLATVAGTLAADSDRIIGGNEARRGQFPYQVSLRRNRLHSCGGAIIAERFVLTAAHCTQTTPANVQVSVGAHSRFDNHTLHAVSRIVNHPRYNSSTIENDISLVQTTQRIVYGRFVRPIGLPTRNLLDENGIRLTISGWGQYRVSVS